jgi:hypothetical protein
VRAPGLRRLLIQGMFAAALTAAGGVPAPVARRLRERAASDQIIQPGKDPPSFWSACSDVAAPL